MAPVREPPNPLRAGEPGKELFSIFPTLRVVESGVCHEGIPPEVRQLRPDVATLADLGAKALELSGVEGVLGRTSGLPVASGEKQEKVFVQVRHATLQD